jgi:hypothetical protein
MGRDFDRRDELPGKGRVAVISDKVWRTQLCARRNVLGKTIVLNAVPYTIIAVMPPGVEHPGNMYLAVACAYPR